MWDCAWCSLPSDSTVVELLPGVEQPPVHTEVPAQPWAQKRRTDTGKHRSAVPHHCFPPQNESWTAAKCCHSTNRVTEGEKDAVMCPRLPWLTEVLPGVQDTILPATGHDLSIRVGCLKAGAVPCSASLVSSTAGPSLLAGEQHFSQLLFSPSLTGRKFALKILPEGIQKKVRMFLPVRLPLRAKKSHFLSRQDLMLTTPGPGNCYVPYQRQISKS